mmetsp:Transcript_17351/g.31251  ORF Transcript_17351/g.31251 Transcript_17351/m.31251 type:complete len:500 (+) Transcript_17351:17558-19057(+)
MGETFKLTEIKLTTTKDAETLRNTLPTSVRRIPRSSTMQDVTLGVNRVVSLPSIFKSKLQSSSQQDSNISTPKETLPKVKSHGSLAHRFIIPTSPKATVIDSIKQSVVEEIEELFASTGSHISSRISKLEDTPESLQYFRSVHDTLNEQKFKHDKLHHQRLHKEKQLKELKEQIIPNHCAGTLAELNQRAADLEVECVEYERLIGTEELLMQTYEYMRLQRTASINNYAAKYRKIKAEVKELSQKLKEKETANRLVEKEIERMSTAEQQLTEKLSAQKLQREELVRSELKKYRSTLEIEVFSMKTKERRETESMLKGQERKLELMEQAFYKAKKVEVLELKLNSQRMREYDIEKGFVELKKVTHAETAEEVVTQYEEVVNRRQQLENIEAQYEEAIEARKAELSELKLVKNEQAVTHSDYGNLVELETKVIYNESIATQKEVDLKRLNETAAQAINAVHQLYYNLKKTFPGYEDTKLSRTRLDETYRRLDALMKVVKLE